MIVAAAYVAAAYAAAADVAAADVADVAVADVAAELDQTLNAVQKPPTTKTTATPKQTPPRRSVHAQMLHHPIACNQIQAINTKNNCSHKIHAGD